MSDATAVAREWLHERSLSLDRTEDLAAMLEAYAAERTVALQVSYDALTGEKFSDRVHVVALRDRTRRAEEQTAALRADYAALRTEYDKLRTAYLNLAAGVAPEAAP